jgi:flagellar assembly protein FliH
MSPPSDPKISPNDFLGSEPGKVGLKGILKGDAQTHALRPAAMDGFQVADFHRGAHVKIQQDDVFKAEIRRLEGQLAQSKSELAQLQDRLVRETKAAHSQGFQEGHFKGIAEGEKAAEEIWLAQIDVIHKEVAEVMENVAKQNEQRFAELRDACVELASGLAQRLFLSEVESHQEIIHRVIAEAFQYLGQEERLRVRVNPLDLTLAEKGGSFWRPISSTVQSVEVVADARIERGGCLVEAEKGGTIDMRVSTMLANLAESVRSAYSQVLAKEEPAPAKASEESTAADEPSVPNAPEKAAVPPRPPIKPAVKK